MRGQAWAALCICCVAAPMAAAQPAPADPDWPCQQRLIPHLSAGSYWAGGAAPAAPADWRNNQKLTDLVSQVTDRDTPDDEAVADLAGYMKTIPSGRRHAAAGPLFGAIVDQANDSRDTVVDRIDMLSRRQKMLGDLIASIDKQVSAVPANAVGAVAEQRTDLAGQRDFNITAFQDAQRTMRYACDVPAAYDRRLGILARALQKNK